MSTRWQWRRKDQPGEVVTVLAIVEGYAIVRFKGAAPWVIALREFIAKWEPVP